MKKDIYGNENDDDDNNNNNNNINNNNMKKKREATKDKNKKGTKGIGRKKRTKQKGCRKRLY